MQNLIRKNWFFLLSCAVNAFLYIVVIYLTAWIFNYSAFKGRMNELKESGMMEQLIERGQIHQGMLNASFMDFSPMRTEIEYEILKFISKNDQFANVLGLSILIFSICSFLLFRLRINALFELDKNKVFSLSFISILPNLLFVYLTFRYGGSKKSSYFLGEEYSKIFVYYSIIVIIHYILNEKHLVKIPALQGLLIKWGYREK